MTWPQRFLCLAMFAFGFFVGFFAALMVPGPDDYDEYGRLRG